MLRGVGKLLVKSDFRTYTEKNESKIPWLTHPLVCQLQSIMNRFVDATSNWTSQRLVENGGSLQPSFLHGAFRTYVCIINNLDNTLNNSSNILFVVKPLSYIENSGLNKRKSSPPSDNASKRSYPGVTKGWLVCLNGSYTFPKNLSKQPCRNYATEGLSSSFGRSCKFKHKSYPKGFCCIDQATIFEDKNVDTGQKKWYDFLTPSTYNWFWDVYSNYIGLTTLSDEHIVKLNDIFDIIKFINPKAIKILLSKDSTIENIYFYT